MLASEPISMSVMRLAAHAFGSSAITLFQLRMERHENATQSSNVAHFANSFT